MYYLPLRSLGKESFCHSSCLSLCLFFAFIGAFQGYWSPGHFTFTLHSQSFSYLWDLRAHLPLLSSESPPTSQKTSPHPKHSTWDKIRTSLSLSAAQHILFKECKISNNNNKINKGNIINHTASLSYTSRAKWGFIQCSITLKPSLAGRLSWQKYFTFWERLHMMKTLRWVPDSWYSQP